MTMPKQRSVCVFCGSRNGISPAYSDLAYKLGQTIADRKLRLVYGGGGIGLMGITARSVRERGGDVLGIIPGFLSTDEVAFDDCELEIVDTLHERKALMATQSTGFIVLPGGIGTLEEVVEVLSWSNLGLFPMKTVFLDNTGYWDPFFNLIEHTIDKGFTSEDLRTQTLQASTPEQALDLLGL
jgi:uncharacterized protein (TIGR00730 family)